MSGGAKNTPPDPARIKDLLDRPDEERWEIVDAHLVPKEGASGKHGQAQGTLFHLLFPYRGSGGREGRPGGWWFATEVLIAFDREQVRRPDVSGWRRENLAEVPAEVPIEVRPDWICEVLSPTDAGDDTVKKMRLYHRAAVGHYWLVDPLGETLTVYRWTPAGYLYVLGATREDTVRAEPFEAIDLRVAVLFGVDED